MMLLICYTILENASLGEHFGEKSSESNVDDDSQIIDFDEIGDSMDNWNLLLSACCLALVCI